MVITMTYQLKVDLDERDFLEIWIPAFDLHPFPELEPGLYGFGSAKLKGAKRAFDSIMIDAFSAAYPRILAEVKRKEPPIEQENYDVPELGLYQVQLSRILEEIYFRFVAAKELTEQRAEVLV
jgi:hypothetical protein